MSFEKLSASIDSVSAVRMRRNQLLFPFRSTITRKTETRACVTGTEMGDSALWSVSAGGIHDSSDLCCLFDDCDGRYATSLVYWTTDFYGSMRGQGLGKAGSEGRVS